MVSHSTEATMIEQTQQNSLTLRETGNMTSPPLKRAKEEEPEMIPQVLHYHTIQTELPRSVCWDHIPQDQVKHPDPEWIQNISHSRMNPQLPPFRVMNLHTFPGGKEYNDEWYTNQENEESDDEEISYYYETINSITNTSWRSSNERTRSQPFPTYEADLSETDDCDTNRSFMDNAPTPILP